MSNCGICQNRTWVWMPVSGTNTKMPCQRCKPSFREQGRIADAIEKTSYCTGSSPAHPRGHSWYRWQPTSDWKFDDTGMRYEAECQTMGCDARRYCQDLEVSGKFNVTGGISEEMHAHAPKGDGTFCDICGWRITTHP